MSLDITAYSNIKRSIDQSDIDCSIRIWKHSVFTDHCELKEGNYVITDDTEQYRFRAGSYSGYRKFLDVLTQCTLGIPVDIIWEDEQFADRPFHHLINFSDCDGWIGPTVSTGLHQDFVENRDRFIRNLKQEIDFSKETVDPLSLEPEFILDFDFSEYEIGYLIEKYDSWLKAFSLAKDNGVVKFH